MDPSALPFDEDDMLAGLRPWVECESPTFDAAAVNRVMDLASRDLVIAGPNPAVHHVVRWRCVDLRDEVARRFEVTVGERAIGKWLRKLELTRLQPRPYHPKKDPAAEEAFKKTLVHC